MECPNCKTPILKTWKTCPECGVSLQKTAHELEAAQLRDENARLKQEKENLEKELADEKKKTGSRLP